ncbi:hypothetical protein GCM10025792_21630 [Pseudonocardia tropica]
MPEAVVRAAVRTPIGKRKGSLAGVHPVDLSAAVLSALAERTGIDPAVVDDVVWGCVNQVGDQAAQIGRYALLAAGWPETVPGVTVNRACGSSQSSFDFAAGMVLAGQYDVVVAGGVESMTSSPPPRSTPVCSTTSSSTCPARPGSPPTRACAVAPPPTPWPR